MKKATMIIASLALMALLLAACAPQQAPEPAVDTSAPTGVPTQPAEKTTVVAGDLVTEVACSKGKVKLMLNNIENKDMNIETDVLFRVAGLIDRAPGCEAETLKPGQSTQCADLGVYEYNKPVQVYIESTISGDSIVRNVDCSQSEE